MTAINDSNSLFVRQNSLFPVCRSASVMVHLRMCSRINLSINKSQALAGLPSCMFLRA